MGDKSLIYDHSFLLRKNLGKRRSPGEMNPPGLVEDAMLLLAAVCVGRLLGRSAVECVPDVALYPDRCGG